MMMNYFYLIEYSIRRENLKSLSTRRTSLFNTLFQVRIPVPLVPGYCIFPATLLQQQLLSDLLPYHQDRQEHRMIEHYPNL